MGPSGRRCPRGGGKVHGVRSRQERLTGVLRFHGTPELGHAQAVREPGEKVQVSADSGAHESEQRVHGQPVDCAELDWCFQEAERDHGPRYMKHDGIAHVGDCNPAAEPR